MFELADKYRMTAMILSDGILGQMMEPYNFLNFILNIMEPDVKGEECNKFSVSKAEQFEDKIESVTCDMLQSRKRDNG